MGRDWQKLLPVKGVKKPQDLVSDEPLTNSVLGNFGFHLDQYGILREGYCQLRVRGSVLEFVFGLQETTTYSGSQKSSASI